MTRKDYRLIAACLSRAINHAAQYQGKEFSKTLNYHESLILELAIALKTENLKFDSDKFSEASTDFTRGFEHFHEDLFRLGGWS